MVSIHSNSLFDISHILISISSFPAADERSRSFGESPAQAPNNDLIMSDVVRARLRLLVDLWLSWWLMELSSLRVMMIMICFRVIDS